VDFLTIYQAEAHPIGGWEAPDQPDHFKVEQASTTEGRRATANAFFKQMDMQGMLAVVGIDAAATLAYGAMPDRFFVVGDNGRIIHCQEQGPFGYKPDELASFLEELTA